MRVEGLETLDYLDNLCNRERFTEQGDALTFESEVCQLLVTSSPVAKYLDIFYTSQNFFQNLIQKIFMVCHYYYVQ